MPPLLALESMTVALRLPRKVASDEECRRAAGGARTGARWPLTAVVAVWHSAASADAPAATTPTRSRAPADAAHGRRDVTDAARRGAREFYAQTLDWQPCDGTTTRLRHADGAGRLRRPDGETIELALLRVPAAERRSGSARWWSTRAAPAPPGRLRRGGRRVFREPLLDSFDIVGFDPRGTGRSTRSTASATSELDAYLADDPTPDDAAEEDAD